MITGYARKAAIAGQAGRQDRVTRLWQAESDNQISRMKNLARKQDSLEDSLHEVFTRRADFAGGKLFWSISMKKWNGTIAGTAITV
jgi:hypothetical protein